MFSSGMYILYISYLKQYNFWTWKTIYLILCMKTKNDSCVVSPAFRLVTSYARNARFLSVSLFRATTTMEMEGKSPSKVVLMKEEDVLINIYIYIYHQQINLHVHLCMCCIWFVSERMKCELAVLCTFFYFRRRTNWNGLNTQSSVHASRNRMSRKNTLDPLWGLGIGINWILDVVFQRSKDRLKIIPRVLLSCILIPNREWSWVLIQIIWIWSDEYCTNMTLKV